MHRLKKEMNRVGITQSQIAQRMAVSQSAISLFFNHRILPKKDGQLFRSKIIEILINCGIQEQTVLEAFEASAPVADTTDASTSFNTDANNEDESMLLAKQQLTQAAKKHFSLFHNPFSEDSIKSADDVFTTPDIRYVREALYQTAKHGGFIAVVGESGAGKSTLRRDLIDRISRDKTPVIVIEPYIIAMEDNDAKGKTLKASSIAEAIINTIAPLEGVKRSQDARFRQLHRLLKSSSDSGYNHVLVIEEAHSLPLPTLKHLKRFFELEHGFKKLLSIVLIGQPELALKLSERNQEVREVVQRCEVIDLPPLDMRLEEFLTFKFGRMSKPIHEVIDAEAIEAIRHKLSNNVGGRKGVISLLYPLAVSNLMIAAMNLAADIGVPIITADVVKGV